MNADGTHQHQVTVGPANRYDAQPSFSPDGKRIVFEGGSNGTGDNVERLYVVNVNGTGLHQLVTPPSGKSDETPRWSPNGALIAFMREPTNDNGGQIMVINSSGSGSAKIVSRPPSGYKDGDPNWSPDASKIAFGRSPWKDLTNPSNDVLVINVNGTGEKNLTNEHDSAFGSETPAFSPDGKRIVYSREADSGNTIQLYVMNADGAGKHSITPAVSGQFDGEPDWQPLASGCPNPGAAYKQGFNAGYNQGYNAGFQVGFQKGYQAGLGSTNAGSQDAGNSSSSSVALPASCKAAYNRGYKAGFNSGYSNGFNAGFNSGFSAGYSAREHSP